jgi:ubiquinone/menaquinone biosynthesis C-methylase UbiE
MNADVTLDPEAGAPPTGNLVSFVNFDRLARVYAPLEWLAFGRALERARFCFLEKLRDCRNILLLGDGDGRCLVRLAQLVPSARLHYVDISPAMLARAAARLDSATRGRVTFTCADIFSCPLAAARYDAVTTMFFLDMFSAKQIRTLLAHIQPALRPGARWLFADFVLPASGVARWRAQAWLRVMYLFFRWQTGISARTLPPSEAVLRQAGWCSLSVRDFSGGFVRATLFSQPACGT